MEPLSCVALPPPLLYISLPVAARVLCSWPVPASTLFCLLTSHQSAACRHHPPCNCNQPYRAVLSQCVWQPTQVEVLLRARVARLERMEAAVASRRAAEAAIPADLRRRLAGAVLAVRARAARPPHSILLYTVLGRLGYVAALQGLRCLFTSAFVTGIVFSVCSSEEVY